MNSNIRIVATLFPRDMICLRNISVDTLHKGDAEDDDDDNDNKGIIIIIIIILVISFMQGIYNYTVLQLFCIYILCYT